MLAAQEGQGRGTARSGYGGHGNVEPYVTTSWCSIDRWFFEPHFDAARKSIFVADVPAEPEAREGSVRDTGRGAAGEPNYLEVPIAERLLLGSESHRSDGERGPAQGWRRSFRFPGSGPFTWGRTFAPMAGIPACVSWPAGLPPLRACPSAESGRRGGGGDYLTKHALRFTARRELLRRWIPEQPACYGP